MNSKLILFVICMIIEAAQSGRSGDFKSTQASRDAAAFFQNQTEDTDVRSKRQTSVCPFSASIACDSTSKYANLDGSCNNLLNPYYAKSNTPMKRYMTTASYDDSLNSPRSLNSAKSI